MRKVIGFKRGQEISFQLIKISIDSGIIYLLYITFEPRNLLANPFNCNCHLAWLGDWLRKRKIVTGNPRCHNPDFLRQIPLQDVAFPDFRCEEGNLWALSFWVIVRTTKQICKLYTVRFLIYVRQIILCLLKEQCNPD